MTATATSDDSETSEFSNAVKIVAATPTVQINDVTKKEGNSGSSGFSFTLTRKGDLGKSSSVRYTTANGSATSGSDYRAMSGSVTFAAGVQSKTITVLVNGDKTKESDETFFVNISNAINCTIIDKQGKGTILNDD